VLFWLREKTVKPKTEFGMEIVMKDWIGVCSDTASSTEQFKEVLGPAYERLAR
jgi:hypothetical protein